MPVRGSPPAAGAAAAAGAAGVGLGAAVLGAEAGGAWLSPGWVCVWATSRRGAAAEDFDDDPLEPFEPFAPNGSWYWSSPAPWAWAGTAGSARASMVSRGARRLRARMSAM